MSEKRPSQPLMVLPPVTWKTDSWTTADPPVSGSMKEQLLREALSLIKGDPGNETAVRDIVDQALEQRLYSLACDAIQAFGPDAEFYMVVSIIKVLDMKYWKYIQKPLVDYSEGRLLKAPRKAMIFGEHGDHAAFMRSQALGAVGRYHFYHGNIKKAAQVWEAGDESPVGVDEVIGAMCEFIAQYNCSAFCFHCCSSSVYGLGVRI